jgi:xylan 1,4-beta-xylosidase
MELTFQGVSAGASVSMQRVDTQHGNVLPRYAAMGKPLDPTPAQVEQLNRETALPSAEETHLTNGKLELPLEPNALVLIKVDR